MKTVLITILVMYLFFCCTNRYESFVTDKQHCDLHGKKFRKKIVKIHYGFACNQLKKDSINYPFPKQKACGGCIVRPEKFATIKFCTTCERMRREAYRKSIARSRNTIESEF